jgi:hypothetical protein
MASTMDVRAPVATPRSGSNAMIHTDGAWQQGTAPSPQAAPRSNTGLIVGLAAVVVGGMVVAGIAAMLMLRSSASNTVTIQVPASAVSAVPAIAPPVISAAVSAAPSASAAPVVTAKHPAAAKDAGAPKKPDDQQAKNIQQLCDHHELLMSTSDPAGRKSAAETAKALNCYRGPNTAQCEKNVCMHACAILNDQECIATAQRGY